MYPKKTRERYGVAVLIDVLRGMIGPKIINDKLNELTTYGIMREYSSEYIRDLIKALIDFGYSQLKGRNYSMLQLNEKSYSMLKVKAKSNVKVKL